MTNRVSVDLDTVIVEENWEGDEILSGPPARIGISAELITLHGPAGGNPVFRYSGAREDLISYLADYFCMVSRTPETLSQRRAEAEEMLGL
jgi:hypothetical protein